LQFMCKYLLGWRNRGTSLLSGRKFNHACGEPVNGHWCGVAVQIWTKRPPNSWCSVYWHADERVLGWF